MSKDNQGTVLFTERQYEFINKMYPERVLPPTATEAELRFYMGQRSLVMFVRDRIQKGSQ